MRPNLQSMHDIDHMAVRSDRAVHRRKKRGLAAAGCLRRARPQASLAAFHLTIAGRGGSRLNLPGGRALHAGNRRADRRCGVGVHGAYYGPVRQRASRGRAGHEPSDCTEVGVGLASEHRDSWWAVACLA